MSRFLNPILSVLKGLTIKIVSLGLLIVFAHPQPYQTTGVAINAQCQVQKSGQYLTNLYAVGNVIGGFNALELGCGSGVAVVTALAVADEILAK